MIALRRFLLLAAACLLLWRIGTSGVPAYYAERMGEEDDDAASGMLASDNGQPNALYRQAIALRGEDPSGALALLARSYARRPTDARPLIAAARIVLAAGEQERADSLVRTAVQLMPADPRVHEQAASYWILRGNLERAMRHWSLALEADPTAAHRLFPLLLELAQDRRTQLAFKAVASSPPSWWQDFFAFAAQRATNVDTVRLLYALRGESWETAVTEAERESYVARLLRAGLTAQAYLAWVNSLTDTQRERLGLLYDGGFELEPGDWGFDWHMDGSKGANADRVYTFGSEGAKSLHLLFDRDQDPFDGVHQALFLDPGAYRLSGKVRTESLRTKGGLKWVVRCLQPEAGDLGESQRFLGSNKWRDFGLEFRVPDSCTLQEIRLVSVGESPLEHKITGSAWFDGLAIARVPRSATRPDTAREAAARLLRIDGEVLITKGSRYLTGAEGRSLNIGDRVIALEGSQAVAQFGDGCTYRLGDDQIFTVSEQSPCALGSASETRTDLLSSTAASADSAGLSASSVPPDAATIISVLGATFDNGDGDIAEYVPIPISR